MISKSGCNKNCIPYWISWDYAALAAKLVCSSVKFNLKDKVFVILHSESDQTFFLLSKASGHSQTISLAFFLVIETNQALNWRFVSLILFLLPFTLLQFCSRSQNISFLWNSWCASASAVWPDFAIISYPNRSLWKVSVDFPSVRKIEKFPSYFLRPSFCKGVWIYHLVFTIQPWPAPLWRVSLA